MKPDDIQLGRVQECKRGSVPPTRAYMPVEFLSNMSDPAPLRAAAAEASRTLRQIADRIPRLRAQSTRISEQDTKRVLITPTIEALGWDIYDTDEVRNEYRHKSADNPVDYALFLNRSPVLFVEAKPLGQSLEDRKWIVQTINYANAAGVDWCVLTNGVEFRIYKVHAQVEADQKLFTSMTLENAGDLDGAVRVLNLLSRDNMRARAIDDLWKAWHVDRQVKEAIDLVLQEDSFIGLIRRRTKQLSPGEVRKSLHRANISVIYPDIFSKVTQRMSAPDRGTNLSSAERNTRRTSASMPIEVADARTPGSLAPQRRLQSTEDLFALGRINAGGKLTIRGRNDSTAIIIDGRTVSFQGREMSFSDWGKKVTGWKAVQIYSIALLPDGRPIDQLRDVPQATKQKP